MKCPYCNRELERDDILGNSQPLYYCKNRNCERTKWLSGTPEFWQELIKNKRALDVARHTIGWINQMIDEHTDKQAIKIKCEYALDQIKQITETKE